MVLISVPERGKTLSPFLPKTQITYLDHEGNKPIDFFFTSSKTGVRERSMLTRKCWPDDEDNEANCG